MSTSGVPSALTNAVIHSTLHPGTSYQLMQLLGEGGTYFALLAMRRSPEGSSLVVFKLVLPEVVRWSPENANKVVNKEAVALERLAECAPATPFVVRLFDAGSIPFAYSGAQLELPWIVVEYVHGGSEGTTLEERMRSCLGATGMAFEPARAVQAIDHLSRGLRAIHDVQVIHRDFTPRNVLCSGFGADELFRVSDFGIARPIGMTETFGDIPIGTPGYAPPELLDMSVPLAERPVGRWTDVFSFAALAHYVLTGQEYFPSNTHVHAIVLARASERPSITTAPGLDRDLRKRPGACARIDRALAAATSANPAERPTLDGLAAVLIQELRIEAPRVAPPARIEKISLAPAGVAAWSWNTVCSPSARLIRHVAWDVDGQCLAATNRGLSAWNGSAWVDRTSEGLPSPDGIRFVVRSSPGSWIVGGDAAAFATYTAEGIGEISRGPDPATSFHLFSGDPADIAVVLGITPDRAPALYTLVRGRWLKPVSVEGISVVNGIARVSDVLFLVCGRDTRGAAFCARFWPLELRIEPMAIEAGSALVTCAANADREVAVATGVDGAVVWYERGRARNEKIATNNTLSASAVDVLGRGWIAAAGQVWMRDAGDGQWTSVWEDREWKAPIVSLFADAGSVVGVSANAAIMQGQSIMLSAEFVYEGPPE